MKIIDVSKHNGTIDWKKVRASGVDGVIIRAGFGRLASQKDIMFETNYKGAAEAGLHIGAYWYSYAVTAAEAEQEARTFLECIKGKKFDLPIYFDIEEEKQVKLGKKLCTDIVNAFCETAERAGYFIGVYSFDSFFASNLDPQIQKKFSCWVARVDGKPPQSCGTYGMWQYSWKAGISGISGNVNISECYKDFPKIIRSAGLNGYGKADTYAVKAEISGISSLHADKIISSCLELGMTVNKEKED